MPVLHGLPRDPNSVEVDFGEDLGLLKLELGVQYLELDEILVLKVGLGSPLGQLFDPRLYLVVYLRQVRDLHLFVWMQSEARQLGGSVPLHDDRVAGEVPNLVRTHLDHVVALDLHPLKLPVTLTLIGV